MKQEIVVCENLSKTFTVGSSEVKAVDGVSFSFERGEFSSIVGPSGSGKTTLLNLIGTLEVPTQGRIIINGTDLSHFTRDELTNFRRKNLGFVFQFFNLIEGLTAFENIELPLIFDSVPYEQRKQTVDSLIQDFNLDYLRDKFPEELSSGERQRVSIMRALVNNPILLLADEPTGNLDTKTGRAVLDLFDSLNKERGTSILLVTHDLSAAKRANRTLHMHDGKIAFDMKMEEMIEEGI
ncbi:MAG: ABC transporter ATP-binding protein [Candidatus Heimdallarchaeota archaeon]|nr:ABC transporter ATP-binding protein [Candidatus Heimdallarchaeota archaeon]